MKREPFFSIDHSINWKNREIPVTVKAVYHRRYPATKYSPEEPAHWEITHVELPEGWDHLEAFAWAQIENDEEIVYELLSERWSAWRDSVFPPERERW